MQSRSTLTISYVRLYITLQQTLKSVPTFVQQSLSLSPRSIKQRYILLLLLNVPTNTNKIIINNNLSFTK